MNKKCQKELILKLTRIKRNKIMIHIKIKNIILLLVLINTLFPELHSNNFKDVSISECLEYSIKTLKRDSIDIKKDNVNFNYYHDRLIKFNADEFKRILNNKGINYEKVYVIIGFYSGEIITPFNGIVLFNDDNIEIIQINYDIEGKTIIKNKHHRNHSIDFKSIDFNKKEYRFIKKFNIELLIINSSCFNSIFSD